MSLRPPKSQSTNRVNRDWTRLDKKEAHFLDDVWCGSIKRKVIYFATGSNSFHTDKNKNRMNGKNVHFDWLVMVGDRLDKKKKVIFLIQIWPLGCWILTWSPIPIELKVSESICFIVSNPFPKWHTSASTKVQSAPASMD